MEGFGWAEDCRRRSDKINQLTGGCFDWISHQTRMMMNQEKENEKGTKKMMSSDYRMKELKNTKTAENLCLEKCGHQGRSWLLNRSGGWLVTGHVPPQERLESVGEQAGNWKPAKNDTIVTVRRDFRGCPWPHTDLIDKIILRTR